MDGWRQKQYLEPQVASCDLLPTLYNLAYWRFLLLGLEFLFGGGGWGMSVTFTYV